MPIPLSKTDVLNREFLEMRAKILELAAALDRLDRASGKLVDDSRLNRIHQGLTALERREATRAEQVQMIFSLPYEQAWRKKFSV